LVPVPAAAVRFAEIALSAIDPNPRQPRQQFDPDALTELVASIRVVGILQPVVVRPSPDADDRFQPSWASVGGAPLGKPG
jgi:ParB family chromosome partitioning protein